MGAYERVSERECESPPPLAKRVLLLLNVPATSPPVVYTHY